MYSRKEVFKKGMHDAIPIMLGYFAVGFSLGIAAKNAGLTPFQGFVTSFLGNASAGEYVAFSIIAAQGTYLEMAIGTLITNARYLLMSASLTQKIDENTSLFHRMLVAFDITDEPKVIIKYPSAVVNKVIKKISNTYFTVILVLEYDKAR